MKMKELFTRILKNKEFQPLRDVAVFAFLLISVHYLYIWWANQGFYPFKSAVDALFVFASDIVFNQSVWLLQNIFHLNHTTDGQTIWVVTNNGGWGYVEVSPGCTSLKQWMHWVFIMLLFPGPWKHKLWYIPAGIIVIHFVNVIRIIGLSLLLVPWSAHFNFLHDYIFKTFFYFMIFVMWVIWVEVFAHKTRNKKEKLSASQ